MSPCILYQRLFCCCQQEINALCSLLLAPQLTISPSLSCYIPCSAICKLLNWRILELVYIRFSLNFLFSSSIENAMFPWPFLISNKFLNVLGKEITFEAVDVLYAGITCLFYTSSGVLQCLLCLSLKSLPFKNS
jgi:hypothetical protein